MGKKSIGLHVGIFGPESISAKIIILWLRPLLGSLSKPSLERYLSERSFRREIFLYRNTPLPWLMMKSLQTKVVVKF